MKSIITDNLDISVFSGAPKECVHHAIWGGYGALRRYADEDGLIIGLTNAEHNLSSNGTIHQIHGNPAAERLSKIAGQLAFEKEHYRQLLGLQDDPAREAFRKRYGISYL